MPDVWQHNVLPLLSNDTAPGPAGQQDAAGISTATGGDNTVASPGTRSMASSQCPDPQATLDAHNKYVS